MLAAEYSAVGKFILRVQQFLIYSVRVVARTELENIRTELKSVDISNSSHWTLKFFLTRY